MLASWKKSYDQPRQHIKKQRHYFAKKGPTSQCYVFSNNHESMWESGYKESWAPKNWWIWTVVLEKTLEETLESPLDSKRSNQSILKETGPEFHWNNWCWSWNSNTLVTWCEEVTHLKRSRGWERLKAGREEDGRGWMLGWHHRLDIYEFE